MKASRASAALRLMKVAGMGMVAAAAVALAGCSIPLPSLSGVLTPKSRWVTGVVSDFITGGGWFLAQDGSYLMYASIAGHHGNFGWHGGVKNGDWWGNGTYIDHELGLHVQSSSVTGYERLGQDSTDGHGHPIGGRQTCGWADTDLYGSVRYLVMEIDNGEPGTNDRFGIALFYPGWSVPFYQAAGSLGNPTPGGGNIQLHMGNASNVPPNQPADCPANTFPE